MSLSFFKRRQSKQHDSLAPKIEEEPPKSPPAPIASTPSGEPAASPVLNVEDEKFLERLAAIAQEPEGTPPPLPTRPTVLVDEGSDKKVGKDAQDAIMGGADQVTLPQSPPEMSTYDLGKEKQTDSGLGRRKSVMSYFNRFKKPGDKDKSKDQHPKEPKEKGKKNDKISSRDRTNLANDVHTAAETAKSAEQKELEKEEKDISAILDELNLSAVNNRVFSFSKESEELLTKFKFVLKDIVNGAPTAYSDLEKLFTDYETTLRKMYDSLPPFLQELVKGLPAKLTATLGPEIMAAQAEKPGFDAKVKAGGKAGYKAARSKAKIPSLKSLITAEGAVATALKSILNFLKMRFPFLLTGTNMLMSLAVFLLLFVFWYCHKRGRETRLERERLDKEEADSAMASSASSFTDGGNSVLGDNKTTPKQPTKGVSSKSKREEDHDEATPPLIIGDGKEGADETPTANVADMPSVSHLPDPNNESLPKARGDTPQLEKPLKVPES